MLPVTFTVKLKRGNARNWPGLILMNHSCPNRAAVWAQEFYESRHRMLPWNLVLWILSKKHRRKMEIMGHEIEVQVAKDLYGTTPETHRMSEARALVNYYSAFKGWTPEQAYDAMAQVSTKADSFSKKHLNRIKKYL